MIVQEMAQDVYTVIGKRLIRGVLLPGAPDKVPFFLIIHHF